MNDPLHLEREREREREREKKVRKAPQDVNRDRGIHWQQMVSCVFRDHERRVIFF